MKIIETQIPDVKIIEPKPFGDERGFFMETWNEKLFRELGMNNKFVQDNHSRSVKNTLRGLHYQIKQAQGKLVRVIRGEVFDVAVDLRKDSPTFGKWVAEYLSESNMRMFWVPPGFAHGFLAMSESVDFVYKCTDYYSPEYERTILWSDEQLNIKWPIPNIQDIIVSQKDLAGRNFLDADVY